MSPYDVIIYHDRCSDGFGAAWVSKQACPHATLIPASYGQPHPSVADKRVLIVDFSYPRDILLSMAGEAASFCLLDHHRTAQAALADLPFAIFDMERSGARLAWDHLFPNQSVPPIIQYVEDRDLWRWQLPHSRAFNAALDSYPHTLESWDRLHQTNPSLLIDEGRAILRYQEQTVTRLIQTATLITVAGYRVPAVNTPVLVSEVAGQLAKDHPFAVAWHQRQDGLVIYSLRAAHPDAPDVSAIAALFGGGGHPRAAGFQLHISPIDTRDLIPSPGPKTDPYTSSISSQAA